MRRRGLRERESLHTDAGLKPALHILGRDPRREDRSNGCGEMLALESHGAGAVAVGGSIGFQNNRVGLRSSAAHEGNDATSCPADLFDVTRIAVAHSPDDANGRKT